MSLDRYTVPYARSCFNDVPYGRVFFGLAVTEHERFMRRLSLDSKYSVLSCNESKFWHLYICL